MTDQRTTSRSSSDGENAPDSDATTLALRQIPPVHEIVKIMCGRGWGERLPRMVMVESVRAELDAVRDSLRKKSNNSSEQPGIQRTALFAQIEAALAHEWAPPLSPIVNATGILLHTGLGRAPITDSAADVISDVARGYAPVEIDIEKGERGKRADVVRPLLCSITGAESATVVNNNAAALMITLAALAHDREVIVSRGELIEIGGSFRLPEVIEAGGARLREVGTTNRTRLRDFESAINEETGAILKVHPSNYHIEGFTAECSVRELVRIAHEHKLPVVHDIGSGMLVSPNEYGLVDMSEPNARESLAAGADVVLFSGDKLLGGPQAGIIIGRKRYIDCIESHPMMRAMRVDKLTLAGLGAVLQIHRDPAAAREHVPALAAATEELTSVRARAERLAGSLRANHGSTLRINVEPSTAFLGGGSVPGQGIASVSVVIQLKKADLCVDEFVRSLRSGQPGVMVRVHDEAIWIDMRCVRLEHDVTRVIEAIENAVPS